ncbi:MAG: lauroyl acyltransferase [Draconibacterium sp.]|nr:MAG: lauroyl acyltransferase [Draconibacterium sp.]
MVTKIVLFFLNLIARLPFSLTYRLSDFLCFFVDHVFAYRRKVIIENLKYAFPEKTAQERKHIMHLFYRHFSDLVLETIKMGRMDESEFRKRLKIRNPEVLSRYYEQGKSVVILTMHYNNWEWGSHLSLYLKHTILAVYKPLHNVYFDQYMINNRSTEGTEMVKNTQVLRRIIKAKKAQQPVLVWLAADQTPPLHHTPWFVFLNRETLFYPGPATLAKQFDLPILFQHVVKTGRGCYESVVEPITENPSVIDDNEIMKAYIEKMEDAIKTQPEYYLWSHKRWKHRRQPEENEKATKR